LKSVKPVSWKRHRERKLGGKKSKRGALHGHYFGGAKKSIIRGETRKGGRGKRKKSGVLKKRSCHGGGEKTKEKRRGYWVPRKKWWAWHGKGT